MNKTFALLATAAFIGFTAPAFAEEPAAPAETPATGTYEKKVTEETKTPEGSVSDETKTKTKVEADGESTTTTTSEHVDDPKGLMNKTKTVTKDEVKHKGGKIISKHKKKVDGKVVENKETSIPDTSIPAEPAPAAGTQQ